MTNGLRIRFLLTVGLGPILLNGLYTYHHSPFPLVLRSKWLEWTGPPGSISPAQLDRLIRHWAFTGMPKQSSPP